jgi:hypothetical protein
MEYRTNWLLGLHSTVSSDVTKRSFGADLRPGRIAIPWPEVLHTDVSPWQSRRPFEPGPDEADWLGAAATWQRPHCSLQGHANVYGAMFSVSFCF